jgi:hypothetical protein
MLLFPGERPVLVWKAGPTLAKAYQPIRAISEFQPVKILPTVAMWSMRELVVLMCFGILVGRRVCQTVINLGLRVGRFGICILL